jgi:hypothetical protein
MIDPAADVRPGARKAEQGQGRRTMPVPVGMGSSEDADPAKAF